VRAFAKDFVPRVDAVDMLFLNAGTASPLFDEDGSLGATADGIEHIFATNYVGHHLLYRLIAAKVDAAPVARVVVTSSASHYDSYEYGVGTSLEQLKGAGGATLADLNLPYGQSKLAQVLWAQELTEQLGDGSSVFVNSFHPGATASEIWEKNDIFPETIRNYLVSVMNDVMWSCDEGALTGLYLGAHVGLTDKSVRGKYFHPQTHQMVPSTHAFDGKLQKRVWQFSDELVNWSH
jgi:NAD(P)-dependent dehydrogenase (short-subunit alcohol dehydrogenase family)